MRKKFPIALLVKAALLCAISVVFGKLPSINLGDTLRLSFENLPVILAGYALGPVTGALVGAVADVLGCLLHGFPINPIITLGAAIVGTCAGLAGLLKTNKRWLTLLLAVVSAHILGSLTVKTVGLYLWYPALRPTLWWRPLIYVITAAAEYLILSLILANRALRKLILPEGHPGA